MPERSDRWVGDWGAEQMREMMRDHLTVNEIPFYQETGFLAVLVAGFAVLAAWLIWRRGFRLAGFLRSRGAFVNEAILVVDLCGSTKLAVTQGDVFAMRIKNNMKACVREVSNKWGARYFESIGDGYMITFAAAADAVKAAIEVLRRASDHNETAAVKEKIELRIGINFGELILDEQNGRHGASINKAFRIEALTKAQAQNLGDRQDAPDFAQKNRIFVSEEISEEIKDHREIIASRGKNSPATDG